MKSVFREDRYSSMKYNRTGKSGLLLPAMSFGIWHNFGRGSSYENARRLILGCFDMGITHIDAANNYGPPEGSAEEAFGQIMRQDLQPYRDELIISSKAGYVMNNSPYGDGGSKKYLVSSLDASLKRMGLDYVDIFYHHRPDPDTPLWETMDALAGIVRSGKALYIGLSNYNVEQLKEASLMLKSMGVRCLIHQHHYSMLHRETESLIPVMEEEGIGGIAFCPLEQGILTGKYLNGIPDDSRAAGHSQFLSAERITDEQLDKVRKLDEIAKERGQSLAQMALVWALEKGKLTSVILGASKITQIEENVEALKNSDFTQEELEKIEAILA
ncbi:MAG: L-glyceraldehyde 3-phosphate reductase [Lachnospiraceae bacterium]|nr:L-glyceraldehyde 3-phosphate reductase [Lachnospiraceae bacterium]